MNDQPTEGRRLAAEQELQELEKLIETRTLELSALSTHLQELAEKEKSELAHKLHDELGGLLTAAKMDWSWLQGRLKDPEPGVQQRLTQLGAVLDEAMDLKRRVVEDLRPSLLDHFGLPTALRAYLEAVCNKAGLAWEAQVQDEPDPIPKHIAIALFRVLQGALTNVLQHAGANRVRLEFSSDTDSYHLRLSDDGRGLKKGTEQFKWSHGLTGMRHRVKALGGHLQVGSNAGQGTALTVQVPKRPAAALPV